MAKSRAQQAAIAISKMSKKELTELVNQVKNEYNSGIYFKGDDKKPKKDIRESEETTFVTGKDGETRAIKTNVRGAQELKKDPNVTSIETAKGMKIKEDIVNLEEMKAGDFAKIKKGTKIALRGYGYVTVVDNDGVILKVLDTLGKTHAINLGQYNEKVLKEGVSCCGRCGRVHESAQDCKKPYISKDSPRHCKNKK